MNEWTLPPRLFPDFIQRRWCIHYKQTFYAPFTVIHHCHDLPWKRLQVFEYQKYTFNNIKHGNTARGLDFQQKCHNAQCQLSSYNHHAVTAISNYHNSECWQPHFVNFGKQMWFHEVQSTCSREKNSTTFWVCLEWLTFTAAASKLKLTFNKGKSYYATSLETYPKFCQFIISNRVITYWTLYWVQNFRSKSIWYS